MLEKVIETSRHFLRAKDAAYRRYFIRTVHLAHRMSIIVGQRGVGKTTTLVQLLLDRVGGDPLNPQILYVQADHYSTAGISLYEIAEQFESMGGKWLAIDEIHKYPNWSRELKSIYDTFSKLRLFVSGSSALKVYRGSHDLVRRSVCYQMVGASFREYLELVHNLQFEAYSLTELCQRHEEIVEGILQRIKVLPEFQRYLRIGYYPYFFEIGDEATYQLTLEQNLHMTIESDLLAIHANLTGHSVKKIQQLMVFIAGAVPFTPNWQHMMQALDIRDPRTLKDYFKHLEDAHLVRGISKATRKFSRMEAPDKIYLDNPNQLYAIAQPNKGTVRETFFLSMLAQGHEVLLPDRGDFSVEGMLFEIGGKGKAFEQIDSSGFLACDDIERGLGRRIPLWLFGFLY